MPIFKAKSSTKLFVVFRNNPAQNYESFELSISHSLDHIFSFREMLIVLPSLADFFVVFGQKWQKQ